ncbi:hypothetical protein [Lacibacter cauensis]|uniref:hypothetical protein n=1 Tax=Lacibacter cauensis TaxID=510947 RepID=UPI001315530F|nr:hypothetical protein [Lacibacter cauensis]
MAVQLLGYTEFGQLLSLPKMAEHYKWHHQLNPSIGFVTFLVQHYIGDDGMSSDNTEDNNLPFKHLHHPVTAQVIIPQPLASFKSNQFFVDLERIAVPYSSSTLAGHLYAIHQPPDVAV